MMRERNFALAAKKIVVIAGWMYMGSILVVGCDASRPTPDEAREQLRREGLSTGREQMARSIASGDLEVIELLLQGGGVDLDFAIRNASSSGATQVLRVLLGRDGIEQQTLDGALWHAIRWDFRDALDLLLRAGADPNARFKGERHDLSALMVACWFGRLAIVQRLIDLGADVNATDHEGTTALGRVVESRDMADPAERWSILEIVGMLIDEGADINAIIGSRKTILMQLVYYGHWPDLIRRMIDAGAEVNAVDEDGRTALHYAALSRARRSDNLKNIAALIEAGVDIDALNKSGESALSLADRRRPYSALREVLVGERR